MSEYKTHLRDPQFPRWTACGVLVQAILSLGELTITKNYKRATCGNCKRTNVYRMKSMGVTRPEWKEDDTERD